MHHRLLVHVLKGPQALLEDICPPILGSYALLYSPFF
jgi:hypothetical protein